MHVFNCFIDCAFVYSVPRMLFDLNAYLSWFLSSLKNRKNSLLAFVLLHLLSWFWCDSPFFSMPLSKSQLQKFSFDFSFSRKKSPKKQKNTETTTNRIATVSLFLGITDSQQITKITEHITFLFDLFTASSDLFAFRTEMVLWATHWSTFPKGPIW